MTFSQTCPRCGDELMGDHEDVVAEAVVAHARNQHRHDLDRSIVLAHLAGRHPYDEIE